LRAKVPDVRPTVPANPVVAGVARTLLLDAAAAKCISTLRAAKIRAILLKGPVTVNWLYQDALRTYTDVDLLVARDELPRAVRTLEGIGYRNFTEAQVEHGGRFSEWADAVEGVHAIPLAQEGSSVAGSTRLPPGLEVDLHWSFHGVSAPDKDFWRVVAGNTERMRVSGTEIDVPSEPARALLLALHAGSFHTSFRQPLMDLDRALELLPEETWRAARRLAVRLDALPRFVAGLRMRPLGLELIDRLHLKGTVDVRSALHAAGAPPPVAHGIVRLTTTHGVGPRMRILAQALAPPAASMRWDGRLARRGKLGLALAYLYRPVWLLAKLPAALRAYARARRMVQADDREVGRFHPDNLRAAWWAVRTARRTRRLLTASGLDAALAPPPPPSLPARAERGVQGGLRRRGESCLVNAIVLQAWEAAHGRRRDLVIGTTGAEDFRAHAWLDGGPELKVEGADFDRSLLDFSRGALRSRDPEHPNAIAESCGEDSSNGFNELLRRPAPDYRRARSVPAP
jgi:hypothetical protein